MGWQTVRETHCLTGGKKEARVIHSVCGCECVCECVTVSGSNGIRVTLSCIQMQFQFKLVVIRIQLLWSLGGITLYMVMCGVFAFKFKYSHTVAFLKPTPVHKWGNSRFTEPCHSQRSRSVLLSLARALHPWLNLLICYILFLLSVTACSKQARLDAFQGTATAPDDANLNKATPIYW